ncbi:hypothetical protein [Segatella copri]|jgi:hypothetical protein|uniref:Uncharacterized protein n=1 Tax=Segatella copri TaxID=165179 RepID=A0AA92UAS9_9BACT|nr:hypothetical protein [Segatella copri]RGW82682.1 hypothetical protein DWV53_00635 [Segatella copri]
MEKNIKKRVCRLALVLSAMLVVLFGYWFFLNPHGYWQKQKEAEKNEYMEKQMLWRKSEKMTMQQMLSDMTLMAKGDSVKVCWLTGLSLSVYRDFIHGTAHPTRNAWAEMRYWYMSFLTNGREWMEERIEKRICKSLIFVESSRFQVQKDSLKDYLNEKPTHTEIEYDKMYPAFGKPTDKEFEDWRKEYKRFQLF